MFEICFQILLMLANKMQIDNKSVLSAKRIGVE